jgi:spore coat polysaccharide biosynthesis protein SpsF (cytidylyltransferase family)
LKVIAILQARCNSSRLPNKVLLPILGKPMIQWQIERLSRCKNIDKLIVATSEESSDLPLVELCDDIGIPVYRGSLNNVLERFYQVAIQNEPEFIVRLTGDCPLIDPMIVDEVIEFINLGSFDYVSNSIEPSYPDGLDVEVFSFNTLKNIYANAKISSEKEHVTLHVANNRNKFKIGIYRNPTDLSHHRWTVDEPSDFKLVTAIFEGLAHLKGDFLMIDVLHFLEKNQELQSLNHNIMRNEGLLKSIIQDKIKN